jgi:hypothetical protein
MSRAPEKENRSWLTPGVRGIGAASFLADLGHEVPTALLPRLLTSLGASATVLGLIEGIADGLAGLMRLLGAARPPLPGCPSRARTRRPGHMTLMAPHRLTARCVRGLSIPWRPNHLIAAGPPAIPTWRHQRDSSERRSLCSRPLAASSRRGDHRSEPTRPGDRSTGRCRWWSPIPASALVLLRALARAAAPERP